MLEEMSLSPFVSLTVSCPFSAFLSWTDWKTCTLSFNLDLCSFEKKNLNISVAPKESLFYSPAPLPSVFSGGLCISVSVFGGQVLCMNDSCPSGTWKSFAFSPPFAHCTSISDDDVLLIGAKKETEPSLDWFRLTCLSLHETWLHIVVHWVSLWDLLGFICFFFFLFFAKTNSESLCEKKKKGIGFDWK